MHLELQKDQARFVAIIVGDAEFLTIAFGTTGNDKIKSPRKKSSEISQAFLSSRTNNFPLQSDSTKTIRNQPSRKKENLWTVSYLAISRNALLCSLYLARGGSSFGAVPLQGKHCSSSAVCALDCVFHSPTLSFCGKNEASIREAADTWRVETKTVSFDFLLDFVRRYESSNTLRKTTRELQVDSAQESGFGWMTLLQIVLKPATCVCLLYF